MKASIHLKRGKEESLKRRHPWVFSGAIHRIDGAPAEGDLVDVYTAGGEFIARGHYQIGSIAVRVLAFDPQETIDQNWWNRKLRAACQLREALQLTDNPDTDCYRLVHGEGDLLPGLIVDIYGKTAVVQCHSVGMYRVREAVAAAIAAVYGDQIQAIYDKSAATVPFKADLQPTDGYLRDNRPPGAVQRPAAAAGSEPLSPSRTTENENRTSDPPVDPTTGGHGDAGDVHPVRENGCRFIVDWEAGQKTGFFLDQRDNRELVRRYAKGRTVLNTFCYTGGFSVYALAGGATHVDSVDSSAKAIGLVRENIRLNFGETAPHTAVEQDAFQFLKETDARYDLIILDPPAFAKHHRASANALKGYMRLNARAMQQIHPGGILFTFSCSQAISKAQFRTAVFSAAAIAGRNVRILHQLTQPADHPINIYHPEGEYLKGLVLHIE